MIANYFDLLQSWKERTSQFGTELNDLPALPEEIFIGGLDLAERQDSTAFFGLKWNGKKLQQYGQSTWHHTKYPIILDALRQICGRIPFEIIGFDETGGGIPIGEFFGEYLTLEPIQLSQKIKLDCMRVVRFLLQNKILEIKEQSAIVQEILEQEKIITEAGNVTYRHPQGTHDDLFWAMALACYVAVPYIVGLAPPAIEATQDIESNDVDTIIRDVMRPFTHSAYGYTWS